jgi:hypothetical protein
MRGEVTVFFFDLDLQKFYVKHGYRVQSCLVEKCNIGKGLLFF